MKRAKKQDILDVLWGAVEKADKVCPPGGSVTLTFLSIAGSLASIEGMSLRATFDEVRRAWQDSEAELMLASRQGDAMRAGKP